MVTRVLPAGVKLTEPTMSPCPAPTTLLDGQNAWEIVRTLVVGYIEEDSIDDGEYEDDANKGSRTEFRGALGGEGRAAAFENDARRTYLPTRRPVTVVGRKVSMHHELMVRYMHATIVNSPKPYGRRLAW